VIPDVPGAVSVVVVTVVPAVLKEKLKLVVLDSMLQDGDTVVAVFDAAIIRSVAVVLFFNAHSSTVKSPLPKSKIAL
jgi:hypothetical protein